MRLHRFLSGAVGRPSGLSRVLLVDSPLLHVSQVPLLLTFAMQGVAAVPFISYPTVLLRSGVIHSFRGSHSRRHHRRIPVRAFLGLPLGVLSADCPRPVSPLDRTSR